MAADLALILVLVGRFVVGVLRGALLQRQSLVPGLQAILGPLLPSDVRVVR